MGALFPAVSHEDADPKLRAIYNEIMERMGLSYVPAWFQCQGGSPRLLLGNWYKIKNTLLDGQVPRLLKELILYNIAKARSCAYCTFAHAMMAEEELKRASPDKLWQVADYLESSDIPSSYKAAIRIVTRCALEPNSTTDDDFEELREEGFSDMEIQEVMAQADLASLLMTISDMFAIELDHELMATASNAPL